MFDSIRKTLRRHSSQESGQSVLEFAITASLFFLLFLCGHRFRFPLFFSER